MKYELIDGRYVPMVYCGNCHKKMQLDDKDGCGKSAIYMMICDEQCGSWCNIQHGRIIDYGIFEDLKLKVGKNGKNGKKRNGITHKEVS